MTIHTEPQALSSYRGSPILYGLALLVVCTPALVTANWVSCKECLETVEHHYELECTHHPNQQPEFWVQHIPVTAQVCVPSQIRDCFEEGVTKCADAFYFDGPGCTNFSHNQDVTTAACTSTRGGCSFGQDG